MKKFNVARSIQSRLVLIGIFTIYSGYGYPQTGVLLECELEGGYPTNQIYVNEAEGYVIYNAQHRESYERQRVFENESGEPREFDVGLDITLNNSELILASNERSSFVFIKETSTFAHAWTMPVPRENGTFLAFGNHHEGKCSVNPFFQPDK